MQQPAAQVDTNRAHRHTGNILQLILDREVGNQRYATPGNAGFQRRLQAEMGVWAEVDFLNNASAQYANLQRAPRSTIAACYSADGQILASTHGDHTVKIVSCMTGETLIVLDGHERTPWVVRFNPVRPQVVASGSLDHEVIVWDASSGQQLLSHNFGKPIASVAFHSNGNIMSVASGHRVYTWAYNSLPASQPAVILKTRKSLRALHFHPLGCPLMLTAEVVERKSSNPEADNQPAPAAAAALPEAAAGQAAQQAPLLPGAATDTAAPTPDQAAAAAVAAAVTAVALDSHPGTAQPTVPVGPSDAAGPSHEPPQQPAASAPAPEVTRPSFPPAGLPLPAFLGHLAQQRPLVMGQPGNNPPGTGPWQIPTSTNTPTTTTTTTAAAAAMPVDELAQQAAASRHAAHIPPRAPAPLVPGSRAVNTAALPPADPAAAAVTSQMTALAQLSTYVEAANRASSIAEHNVWLRVLLQQRHQLLPSPPCGRRAMPHPVSILQDAMLYEAIAAKLASEQRLASCLAYPSRGNPFWALLQATGYPWLSPPRALPGSNSQSGSGMQGPGAGLDPQQAHTSSAASPSGTGAGQQGAGGGSDLGACPLIPLVPPPHQEPLNSHAFDLNWGWEVSPVASEAAAVSLREVRSTLLHRQLPVPSTPEQPCIVSLNLWPFNTAKYNKPLSNPRLQLPRTVLCSEMGACFSRCGRLLVVCVATDEMSDVCAEWLRSREARVQTAVQQPGGSMDISDDEMQAGRRQVEPGPQQAGFSSCPSSSASSPSRQQHTTQMDLDAPTADPSARGPRDASPQAARDGPQAGTAGQIPKPPTYELRVYSLDGPTFGQILHARPMKAAHCLTSIQLSPTGKHLLAAYGRRHISLCSLLADGGQLTPVHTVMEIYRVRDMQLVRRVAVLEDEVNVAAWHPFPGGGLLYGTKEGKLRLFRHDRRPPARRSIPITPRASPLQADEELWEAERSAGRDSNSDDDKVPEASPAAGRSMR